MHRFYLPPEACRTDCLTLSGHETHHALNVLRIRQRERVVVLNGAGDEFHCEVNKASRHGVTLRVLQKTASRPLPNQITLVQAVPRGRTMELIIQKATELGTYRIVPVLSERTIAHVEPGHASGKVKKWEATAIEAIKQCGSAWLPRVEPPVKPKAFLGRGERFDLSLIASLQGDARHPREHFRAFVAERGRLPASVCVWVGPEGDFTPAEVNVVRAAGALPITLGQLVLRSETAAIYCLSVINYELQAPSQK